MDEIRCIAVDDEYPALRVIERYVSRIDKLTLIRKFSNPYDALNYIKSNPFHILFLDISMPEMTGLEMINKLSNPPVIIFTTAYSEFATDAFDLDAADYLVKPFSFDRFQKGINKAIDIIQLKKLKTQNHIDETSTTESLNIKCDGKLVKLAVNEIVYIQAYQEYVSIFTMTNKYFVYERMKNIEKLLPKENFLRVHRSYIVNLGKIESFSGSILEVSGFEIPVSRSQKDEVFKRIM